MFGKQEITSRIPGYRKHLSTPDPNQGKQVIREEDNDKEYIVGLLVDFADRFCTSYWVYWSDVDIYAC